ncbi:hypothetical protein BHM03_00018161 [Ensete ventricosum]|nr:hypothetical protein BHM03_00018161 [Ensete ventricosum]
MVNSVALPPLPEAFPWLSPRISFGHDPTPVAPPEGRPDGHAEDFEFRRHDDPVTMLPADELFSGCKLVPFQLAAPESVIARSKPPETDRKVNIAGPDSYAFSPRAPRCTTLWRELLGLRRAPTTPPGVQVTAPVTSAAVPAASKNPILRSSIKHLLHRRHKPASPDASLSLPILRDSDRESVAIASRISLSSSSSSSGPDQEDLGRLSIDSDKPSHVPPRNQQRRPRRGGHRWLPADELHGLERSSSSPGSFTGGPRPRPRRAERSYSANVRVAPVLNVVPVCSLRGSGKPVSVFGLAHVFPPPPPPQKKDRIGSAPLRTGLRWPGRPSVRGLKDGASPPSTRKSKLSHPRSSFIPLRDTESTIPHLAEFPSHSRRFLQLIDAVPQPVYPLIAHFPAHGCLEKSTFGYLHRVLPRYRGLRAVALPPFILHQSKALRSSLALSSSVSHKFAIAWLGRQSSPVTMGLIGVGMRKDWILKACDRKRCCLSLIYSAFKLFRMSAGESIGFTLHAYSLKTLG